jgi:hypothetical protein
VGMLQEIRGFTHAPASGASPAKVMSAVAGPFGAVVVVGASLAAAPVVCVELSLEPEHAASTQQAILVIHWPVLFMSAR